MDLLHDKRGSADVRTPLRSNSSLDNVRLRESVQRLFIVEPPNEGWRPGVLCGPKGGTMLTTTRVSMVVLALSELVFIGCTYDYSKIIGPTRVVECTVTRQECVQEQISGDVGCAKFVPVTFVAKECRDTSQGDGDATSTCKRVFCPKAGTKTILYDYPDGCQAIGTDSVSPPADTAGICTVDKSPHRARIAYMTRGRDCTMDPTGVFCASLSDPAVTEQTSACVDVASAGAMVALRPTDRDAAVNIFSINLNDGSCPLAGTASASAALTFAIPAGSVGSATAPGTQVALTSSRGLMSIGERCDEAGCTTSLDGLRVDFADMTVLGSSLTSLSVINTVSADRQDLGDGIGSIDPQALRLTAFGKVDGVDHVFNVRNDTPWDARFEGTGFRLQGTMDILTTDPTGRLIPIQVSADIPAVAADQQALTCASLSPIGRLFGFEDPLSWSSTAATLSLVTTPLTQGCGGLGISGQGYIPINGEAFPSAGLTLQPALSVDLFVPNNQPNPFWLGALQMYLSCPSGNVFNQYIGQAELTGLPQNQFSTLRFPLPAAVTSTLQRGLNDCAFSFALNVNNTNRVWILDNLRFTQ